MATLLGGAAVSSAQLAVSFGAKGLATLSYNGTRLEDTSANPSDVFHIYHLQATDLSGNILSAGQYGWGENNNGESWNAQTRTETYNYSWGSIATQFVQNGNNLDMVVTETNYSGSGMILDGAEIFPFALHLPNDPAGFNGYSTYAFTTRDPGVTSADYGAGVVTSVIPNEAIGMYGGWKNLGTNTYSPVMTTTAPSGLATFYPQLSAPVKPGSSLTYTVSLRFTNEGTAANAQDAYTSFADTYPSRMTWTDKRILGTAYLASSPTGGDITQPGGYPTNPRRYFNDASVDVTSAAGLRAFQDRILAQAASNVTNAKLMDAQGVITWDLEGEEYPQTTSYVCSPDKIATVAPEMESTVTDPLSPWHGYKLDDAYFRTMTNAGLRVGLCLRPQVFTPGANNTASQITLGTNAAIIGNLETKARFANSRWGATIFYVDSTVDTNGGTLDPAIFEQLITDLPTFLFIPEESTTRYYAYSAPFYSFIYHQTTGTPAAVYQAYPNAFGANLVNDVNPALLTEVTPQLTNAVRSGDILMGHADYWQANDPALVSIYGVAGIQTTVPRPPPVPAAQTSISLNASETSLVSGEELSLTATVSPSAASGQVTFYDGTTVVGTGTLNAGAATFTSSTLAVGAHALTAAYNGTSAFAGSTSGAATVEITSPAKTPPPATINTNLVADPGFELQTGNNVSAPWVVVGSGQHGIDRNRGYAHSGANDAWIWDDSNDWNALQQTVAVQPNTEYVFSAWVRTSFTGNSGYLSVLDGSGAVVNEVNFGNASTYKLLTVKFNSGHNTSVTLRAGFWGQNTVQWLQLDDVALRPNLLLDPGFELQHSRSLASPWTQIGSGQVGVDVGLGNAHTGANNAWVWDDSNDWNAVAQTVALKPYTNYAFTGWIRSSLIAQAGYFSVDGATSILKETSFAALPGYTQLTVTFNSGANTSVRVRAGFWGHNAVQWIQTDDFTLQQTQ